MSWEYKQLGDIIEIKKGAYITKKESNEGPYPVILGGQEPAYYIDRFNHTGKAIVISRSGASAGYVSFWNEPIFVTDGFLIEPKKSVDINFLYYLIKSHQAELQGKQGGAAIPHVTPRIINAIQVMVPDLEIQERIVDILSAYDSLIENNQKQIKLLEEAAQRLYKEWFVDLRFPGHENTPIIDGVPEGWRVDEVKSVVSLLSGYAFKSNDFVDDGEYKIVTIKNVQDGNFDGENVNLIAEIPSKMPEHCILKNGDILLSLTGNVGRVCLVNGDNYLLNQRVAKLYTKYSAYAYCLFRSKDMFDTMNNLANGAAQQNLSPIRTENVRILIPNDSLIQKFEEIVSPMIAKMLVLNQSNGQSKQARDRLLPKLMSGELEV